MAHVENPGRCLSQRKCTEGSLSHCCLSLRHIWLSLIPWTTAHQASLSFSMSQSLLKFMFIELIQSDRIISFSVDPFSSCPQSFPASGSFPVSGLFPSAAEVLELQLCPRSSSKRTIHTKVWVDLVFEDCFRKWESSENKDSKSKFKWIF